MNFWIGVTDNDWFHFLGGLQNVDEVNFWQPRGGRRFRALERGALPIQASLARQPYRRGRLLRAFLSMSGKPRWEAFGEKNEAPSLDIMRANRQVPMDAQQI